MFKDVPEELEQGVEFDAVAETLSLMDKFGIEVGLVSHTMPETPRALREHPDRFIGCLAVDGNLGMDQIRQIAALHGEGSIRAVSTFPSASTRRSRSTTSCGIRSIRNASSSTFRCSSRSACRVRASR